MKQVVKARVGIVYKKGAEEQHARSGKESLGELRGGPLFATASPSVCSENSADTSCGPQIYHLR